MWKERTDSHKLSSDLHCCAMLCIRVHTHIHTNTWIEKFKEMKVLASHKRTAIASQFSEIHLFFNILCQSIYTFMGTVLSLGIYTVQWVMLGAASYNKNKKLSVYRHLMLCMWNVSWHSSVEPVASSCESQTESSHPIKVYLSFQKVPTSQKM